MTDEGKTREQLLGELEASDAGGKRAEVALWESDAKYRRLVETTNDWVWTIDNNAEL